MTGQMCALRRACVRGRMVAGAGLIYTYTRLVQWDAKFVGSANCARGHFLAELDRAYTSDRVLSVRGFTTYTAGIRIAGLLWCRLFASPR